ncbi:uncharacterized protein LAESUDRAFT_502841 [Laetiporus sulphureus 93-53]|uniref:Uncharacterized protein n=1 Tax=Laetiporus sulphureus 93-53 TaxID=1314785 RepID=A0A165BF70_9APHY|nr:uncharacterized protein LAESUDRAFT_502841 [Laetiporus sulphureus 93-53]KZT00926.1 hypothetical protein LAESUDRAFT_502841 [Laetiporus sulphureus 93-53]
MSATQGFGVEPAEPMDHWRDTYLQGARSLSSSWTFQPARSHNLGRGTSTQSPHGATDTEIFVEASMAERFRFRVVLRRMTVAALRSAICAALGGSITHDVFPWSYRVSFLRTVVPSMAGSYVLALLVSFIWSAMIKCGVVSGQDEARGINGSGLRQTFPRSITAAAITIFGQILGAISIHPRRRNVPRSCPLCA